MTYVFDVDVYIINYNHHGREYGTRDTEIDCLSMWLCHPFHKMGNLEGVTVQHFQIPSFEGLKVVGSLLGWFRWSEAVCCFPNP